MGEFNVVLTVQGAVEQQARFDLILRSGDPMAVQVSSSTCLSVLANADGVDHDENVS